ncbi:MAG: hypothetical protein GX456_01450 [Verrucomicrobia bacterium]|nr:hypothetical protein [Verrucomicrobiota bacterium]
MNVSKKTITGALEELGAELGTSEADFCGKVKIEGKDPVIEKTKNDPAMKAQTAVPFVDTNIIPDRNAGIGSLLWDLQNPQDPDRDGPPLVDREFAFIDVGVSRARVATALKRLLANDLKMAVDYVATERPEAVPYANVTLVGDRAEQIRACLSRIFSSKGATCEVKEWHFVVDLKGKVSSVSYSYHLHGNEVWEAYFMGRPFLYAGEPIEFTSPELDETLAADVHKIEARIDSERKRDGDPSRPAPSWDGYRVEKNPLEAGLAELGITLQRTDVPQRIKDRQNVLFLGNVLNHYPQDEQARELDRIAANMEEGDLVIIQVDEVEAASIEVLQVKGQWALKTRERVRWINTKTLEIQQPDRVLGSWRQIRLKPEVQRMVSGLIECLGRELSAPEGSHKNHRVLVHQHISHVFGTFFRALPVEETLRIAIREALRRLPFEGGPEGIPAFKNDAKDAYGGALWSDTMPLGIPR